MAATELELKNMNANFAQISLNPSGKIVEILSKCTYENDEFKRIVGAVTIIFTDSTDVTSDKSCSGGADQLCNGKVWRNIPSTLSVLPSAGHRPVVKENSVRPVQSSTSFGEYHTDTQLNGKEGGGEGKNNGDRSSTLDMGYRTSPINTSSSSLLNDRVLIDSSGTAIFIKEEPMSPDLNEEDNTKVNFENDSAGSVLTKLSQGDNTTGVEDSLGSHIVIGGETNFGPNNDGKRRHSSGNKSLSKCSVCFREIYNRKDFTFHAKSHKNVLGSRESCPVCLKSYKRRISLMRHSYLHLSNDLYCCPVCQVNISQLDSFKRHFHKRHPAALSKLRRYLANFRHNIVSKQMSDVAGVNGQSAMHHFSPKECLDKTNVEKNRRALCSVRKSSKITSAQRNDQLRSRKQSFAQKMQLDVSPEGFQGVNFIRDMDQSSPDSSLWHDHNTNTNMKGLESGSSNQTKSSLSGTGYFGSTKTKKTSKCSFCWSEMINLEDFVDHMEAHKAIMKVPYTCPVCLHEFSDKMRVKRHASRHVQTAMYVCRLCKIQIPRVDSFRRHIKKVHPQHDMELILKHSMPSSDVTEGAPERYNESTNVPINSSDAYCMQHPKLDNMYSRKKTASCNFSDISTKEFQIKQEMNSSENEDYVDADPYTEVGPLQPSATMSMLDVQGYPDEFVPNSDPSSSVVEPPLQHDLDEPTDTSWHVDDDQQFAKVAGNTMTNPFLSKNTYEGSTSASHSSNAGTSFDIGNTANKSSSPATFLAPKRGGYRHNKTPVKFDPSSPSGQHGLSAKKKAKKKDLTSVCFFCPAVLTNTQQFLEHARLHAQGDKITCPVCVTDYARKLGLMRHSVNHVPSDAHICDICGTSFARRDVMLRHYRKVHKITPNYMRQETFSKSSDSQMLTGVPDPDELPILSFDSITAPSIPPMPGDSDSQMLGAGMISMADEDDMMYSCGLCGAQYHDAEALQNHVQNHPHDM